MSQHSTAYQQLAAVQQRLYHFEHVQAMLGWDQAVNMPPKGQAARAAALAELALHMHALRTDPAQKAWLDAAEQEDLSSDERANLREMRRLWVHANALPADLVQAQSLAASNCEHAWRAQRPANDWAGFATNLREVLRLARQEAQCLSQALGVSPYDALLDRFEPGMRSQEIDRVFGDIKAWLPGLIQDIRRKQDAAGPALEAQGPFGQAEQAALCRDVAQHLGLDFDAGRLDVSVHPFCGGSAEDVRITTRFKPDDCTDALLSVVHEIGHARYEQNRPAEWLGQPLGLARSMGIHESQSLSFERQLAGHPAFIAWLAPRVSQHLGHQAAFEPDNLVRMTCKVSPSLIRVEADEVTYPAHVILRYEIERALIEGEAEVDDIPAMWNERMQSLLGLDTRGDYRNGPMQDVHWPSAAFGYFPCYTLGAMYAAQWFACIRRSVPDLDTRIAQGDFAPIFDWLRQNIWQQASRFTTPELVQRASGEPLNPAYFQAHLRARYL